MYVQPIQIVVGRLSGLLSEESSQNDQRQQMTNDDGNTNDDIDFLSMESWPSEVDNRTQTKSEKQSSNFMIQPPQ
jgi:hypothetical protein